MGIKICSVILIIILLSGCFENSLPSGVVAQVNGENIYLHSLQTLLDSRTGSLGLAPKPSVEEMQKNYTAALGVLIAHALVRQELKSRGIAINQNNYKNFIDDINREFPDQALDEFFREALIRKEDWEQLMQDYMAMETFKNRVLQPGLKIELNEIKNYYQEHKNDFQLPPLNTVCFASSNDRENLENWCKNEEKSYSNHKVELQCGEYQEKEFLENFTELKNLKENKCAAIKEKDDQWQTFFLRKKQPAMLVPLTDAYALIENILLEEKQHESFENWLAEKISKSDIKVAPALNEAISNGIANSAASS